MFSIKNWEIPLYRGEFIIILSDCKDNIRDYISDFDSEAIYAHTYYSEFKKQQGFYIILNFNSEYRDIKHGTITHESVHATNMILNSRGIISDFENDEASAYLAEWITDKIYSFINEKNYKIK